MRGHKMQKCWEDKIYNKNNYTDKIKDHLNHQNLYTIIIKITFYQHFLMQKHYCSCI
jgi:hypothetical protein